MLRGAAILRIKDSYTTSIIPFLLKGDDIKKDNIGVIMFQVTNDAYYTDTPTVELVRCMGSRDLGVVSPSVDISVIRLFFALAAETPTLQRVDHASFKVYTTVDNSGA